MSVFQSNRLKALVSLFLIMLVSACASSDKSHIQKAPTYVHPELQKIGELPPYKIQIGDIIEVKFFYNDEFNQEIIVRPDGRISTAAVQSVKAAGRTPDDLGDQLTQMYKVHLKEPHLSVLVKSYVPTRIYIIGDIKKPGEYESLRPNPSLLETIARAGDIAPTADGDQILIVRKNYVAQPTFYLASYNDVVEGINPLADVQLTSGDVVYISQTPIDNFYEIYTRYVKGIMPAGFGFGYSLN